jgi:hypothetical protein
MILPLLKTSTHAQEYIDWGGLPRPCVAKRVLMGADSVPSIAKLPSDVPHRERQRNGRTSVAAGHILRAGRVPSNGVGASQEKPCAASRLRRKLRSAFSRERRAIPEHGEQKLRELQPRTIRRDTLGRINRWADSEDNS